MIRWVFNAEKPGAFPQEKTDTSYPRASLGSCQGNCWPQLAHTSPTRLVWGLAGVISLPGFQNRTQGHTGASLFFLPRTSSPLPLKGEGQDFAHLWGFGFSLAVALATAGHNRATLAQQGRCGASMVSLPYLASKTAHRATQGRVWFWPTGWRFSGGSPSLPAIPCK